MTTDHQDREARPALVVDASSPADVRAAVITARERDLSLAVYATGHGTMTPAGGCLLLRTEAMSDVLVDPERQLARVGSGARWGQVIDAAAPFGLAPLSGSSPTVGVTGYTLGGGAGWLSRRYGFAADSLVSARVVTADGRLVTASADRNPDLFWALRGGGGNFGVVTSLEFRLHPVDRVYAGAAYFPIDGAAETLTRFRDTMPHAPRELAVSVVLMRQAPDPSAQGPVVAIRGLYAGEPDDAMGALKPLFSAAGGAPLADHFRPMSYADSGTIGGTAPHQFELFKRLSDDVIRTAIDAVTGSEPAANAVEIRHWGGAMAKPGPGAGPIGHRGVPFSATIDGPRDAAEPFARHATGGSFLNFLHDPARTRRAYTAANYERLRELKRVHDPDNIFGREHNIPPAAPAWDEAQLELAL